MNKIFIKRGSIKIKLLLVPLVILLIGVIVIGAFSSYHSRKSLLDEMRENGFFVSESFVDRIEGNTEALKNINIMLEDKIRSVGKVVIKNQDKLTNEYLVALGENLGVNEIYLYNSNGEIIFSTVDAYLGWVAPEGHPVHQFMTNGEKDLVEEIRKDSESDNYNKYGYVRGENDYFVQVGVRANIVKTLTEKFSYQTLVKDIASNDNIIYALFIDKDLKSIAHSKPERVGIDLSNDKGAKTAILEKKAYATEYFYEVEREDVYDVVYPVEINGEVIGAINIGYSMKEVEAAISKNIIIVAITGIIVFLLIAFMLYRTSNGAIRTIYKLKEQLSFMSLGDFGKEVSKDLMNRNDEFGQIAIAVDSMQNSVRNILVEVIDKSQQVAASSEELTATSQQSATASEEVAKTIEEIARGASDQARDTETSALSVEEMGSLLEQNTEYTKELNHASEEIEKHKEEGFVIVKNLIEKTKQSNDAAKTIYEIIMSNNDSAEKIENASTMIQNIADQTNLLALNAAIEAARAGDAGRGFAVVAEEIRKLAEESNNFTEEIKKVIEELKVRSRGAVSEMNEVKQIVDSQVKSVKQTEEKFGMIASSIEITNGVIGKLNRSVDMMLTNKDKLIDIMQNLSAIAEENAAGTEEASAAVEEQSASMQEIANASEGLAHIGEELQSLVNKFKF